MKNTIYMAPMEGLTLHSEMHMKKYLEKGKLQNISHLLFRRISPKNFLQEKYVT